MVENEKINHRVTVARVSCSICDFVCVSACPSELVWSVCQMLFCFAGRYPPLLQQHAKLRRRERGLLRVGIDSVEQGGNAAGPNTAERVLLVSATLPDLNFSTHLSQSLGTHITP